MREQKKTRPAGGTAERAGQEKQQTRSNSQKQHTTWEDDGQRKVSDLLGRGQENAVSRRHLEKLTELDGRTVRRMIERERREGVPILADNATGYYLPATEHEKAACVRSMRHRAGEIMKPARAIERAKG